MNANTDGDEPTEVSRSPTSIDELIIQYCISNVDPDSRARLEATDAAVRATSCLQRCGSCYEGPFLVLDGEFVAGDHLDLLERVAEDEP